MPISSERASRISIRRSPATGHTKIGQTGRVDERYELVDLVVEREKGITASFADGHVATFELGELRLGCPCATCRDLRDRGTWPRPSVPTTLTISDARFHGAWGLNITWNDGHSTGIYTFEALRRWSEGGPPYGPDSGLAGG
jgi:prepilin-type processing-associated H-X9-DG protein